jgi:hypothetical protein
VRRADLFVREMELTYGFAEESRTSRFLNKHLSRVKKANYSLVFALNLNLLLSPSDMGRIPAVSWLENFNGDHRLTFNQTLSLFLTTLLAALATVGYAVIAVNIAAIEVPLLIEEFDAAIRTATSEAVGSRRVKRKASGGTSQGDSGAPASKL